MVCFFFKQKTAYEMRISDWSSDVCSSDLLRRAELELGDLAEGIKLRVGEGVGRGFGEAERDEHHALRHVAIAPDLELDLAAPCGDAHLLPGGEAHAAERSDEHPYELQ